MDDGLHPVLERHGSFAGLPLGRLPRRDDPHTLRFARYLDDAVALPALPAECDRTVGVQSWPMYANDRLGDCTCAAAGHMIQAWTAASGGEHDPSVDDVTAAYWATGSADTGRVELDVLNYWRQTGIGGDKILAYAAIDPANLDHVKAAIVLFGGVYAGVALPVTAQQQAVWDVVGDGQTGDSQPGSWGGHAIPYLAYNTQGQLACVTWGSVLRLTDAFNATYCDEAYAVISPDWLPAAKLAGFDTDALTADLAAITV